VVPGAETGVLLADQLADKLGTRSNPLELSLARRNKWIMGETVRAAGVRAARQHCGRSWADISAFLAEWQPSPFLCVVKPIQSAGSDDVFKCSSAAEVKAAFEKIDGAINGLGVVNEGVLVQEFLAGTEYVVDSVSRDGVHKVTAIWEYDKRAANGQFNVYFGTYLRAATGPLAESLVAYAKQVRSMLNRPGLCHNRCELRVAIA
jgi:biotin carboxylase